MSDRYMYFGCAKDGGHHWHTSEGKVSYAGRRMIPSKLEEHIDGLFAPRLPTGGEAPQGQCSLHFIGSLSLIAYWDRAGDSRPNSNSAFVWKLSHKPLAMIIEEMKPKFPWVFARQSFELVPYGGPNG